MVVLRCDIALEIVLNYIDSRHFLRFLGRFRAAYFAKAASFIVFLARSAF